LKVEGRVLEHKDNLLKAESKSLTRKIVSEKAALPVVHSKGKLAAREFDDLFERDFDEVEFDARDFDDELYLD